MSGQDRCVDLGFGNMIAIHTTPQISQFVIREGNQKPHDLPSLLTPGCAQEGVIMKGLYYHY